MNLPNRPDLWTLLREMLSMMRLALGAPALIAAIEKLSPKTRRDILDWLEPLERLTRKLLLIEAAKLPKPAMAEKQQRLLTKARVTAYLARLGRAQSKRVVFDAKRSSTWRVSFALVIPPDPLDRKPPRELLLPCIRDIGPPILVAEIFRKRVDDAKRAQREARREAARALRARRLAERYEALCRVIAEPGPHVERLAHKLWRKRGAAAHKARLIAEARPPRRVRHRR
ncbi:MAG TPA: hypothetical protein VG943_09000 [Caulobacterales bacterium]|nr:hypothetical protein [Caulobacterales bacterium]